MKFSELELKGAYLIEPELKKDERGFFARTWDRAEFAVQGLETDLAQFSVSFNKKRGTLRGLHYQEAPHEEAKLVRCTMGIIYDVIVDIRPASPTFKKWLAFELSAENRKMIYAPKGFAHGFQSLADNTEVFYQISEIYMPESAKGLRWNDPVLSVSWPLPSPILSERDQSFPNFKV